MKLSSRILNLLVISSLILIFSCGKKKAGGIAPGYRPGGNIPGYVPPNVAGNIQAYYNHYACPNGRLPEVTFSANQFYQGAGGNTTQIQGQLQPSAIGGSPSNTYIGVNSGTNDIIIVTKMTSGGRVVGFNISLSLCRHITQVNSGYGIVNIPILDRARMPSIAGSNPIIVMDPTNCAMGSVDQALVYLNIPPYRVPNTNATFPATQMPVSFARPGQCF